jgi:DNA-binding response OmpR family regulator
MIDRLFPGTDAVEPRFRQAGEITLDRAVGDGRADDHWFGFKPVEFALLWCLSGEPGRRMGRPQLAAALAQRVGDAKVAEMDALAENIRAKLAARELSGVLVDLRDGGFRLYVPAEPGTYFQRGD